jgi:multidrug efflux pump subunit AcrA (membrane-fusion protein)
MRIWKNARLAAVALIVLAIMAVALWPEAVEVDVARVTRGPLQVTIDEEGETRVHDRFVVYAPVAGRLQRIELEPGDPVTRRKTVVARLAPTPSPLLDARTRAEYQAAVDAARAAVGQARADRDRRGGARTGAQDAGSPGIARRSGRDRARAARRGTDGGEDGRQHVPCSRGCGIAD